MGKVNPAARTPAGRANVMRHERRPRGSGNGALAAPAIGREEGGRGLSGPALLRRANELRATDNRTNWGYIAREYLALAIVIGGAIAFFEARPTLGVAWGWNLAVEAVAVAIVGACQHRLSTLAHEASHGLLFRDRMLNELASDWLCMLPLFSTTHGYRIQHLAHHQHVNDPEHDPDLAQLEQSGHRFRFPMERWKFIWSCVVRQLLWPPGLVRYVLARARYASTGGTASRWPFMVAILYVATLVPLCGWLAGRGDAIALAVVPIAVWMGGSAIVLALPRKCFAAVGGLRPVIGPRATLLQRMGFVAILFAAIAWGRLLTGRPVGAYFGLLWLLPLATSFPLVMMLRQVVQHGHADRGRLTNTRVFRVGGIVRFAVFPLGMDYQGLSHGATS